MLSDEQLRMLRDPRIWTAEMIPVVGACADEIESLRKLLAEAEGFRKSAVTAHELDVKLLNEKLAEAERQRKNSDGLYREIVKRIEGAFIISGLGDFTEWQAAIDSWVTASQAQGHLAVLASERYDKILELEQELLQAEHEKLEAERQRDEAKCALEKRHETMDSLTNALISQGAASRKRMKELMTERDGAQAKCAEIVNHIPHTKEWPVSVPPDFPWHSEGKDRRCLRCHLEDINPGQPLSSEGPPK
jgi:hypothetical protein